MPMVGMKKFAYTEKGKKQAKDIVRLFAQGKIRNLKITY